MKDVLVSIVTVVLNDKNGIEKTINSVVRQTYLNIEYIIVDGGSTDGTLDILNSYDEEIECLISESDDGIYDAMNKGLNKCSGDIVGIINSGDYYESNAIELIVNSFATNGDGFVYFGNLNIVDNCKRIIETKLVNVNSYFFLKSGMHIYHPTVFVPSKIYSRFGLFNLKYTIAADYDLLYRLICSYNVGFIYINKVIANFSYGGVSSNIVRVLIESYYLRIDNGMYFIESGLYLIKSLIVRFFSLFLNMTNMRYIIELYRRFIIKNVK